MLVDHLTITTCDNDCSDTEQGGEMEEARRGGSCKAYGANPHPDSRGAVVVAEERTLAVTLVLVRERHHHRPVRQLEQRA